MCKTYSAIVESYIKNKINYTKGFITHFHDKVEIMAEILILVRRILDELGDFKTDSLQTIETSL